MRAGKLDRIITIERCIRTVSDAGTVTEVWAPLATVRAQLIEATTREFFEARGEGATSTVAFRVRWRAGLTTADRITYAGAAFNVVELKELGRRAGLEIRCERIAP